MSKTRPLPLPTRQEPLVVVQAGPAPQRSPDLQFGAAARLAAQICGAPMAFAASIDGHKLAFLSSVGIERPRLESALGAWDGVRSGALLVIEDLQREPCSVGVEPLRFYAGAPVFDGAGRVAATVAALDVEPRGLDAAQRAGLQDLANVLGLALQASHRADELARVATVDPLTGVANRKQFDIALVAELHHAMRTGEPFTLLLLSLDGVLDIRNGFGAAAADLALREVSARMAHQVRLGDLLARLGGSNFGAVMRHGAADAAELLAKRIVDAVRHPITLDSGDVVGLRVCIGLAAYDDSVDSVAALTSHAEIALKRARQQHEQRWNFFGRKFEMPPSLRLVAGDEAEVGPAD